MAVRLPTLKTSTPEAGYDVAVRLARVAVKLAQPDTAVRDRPGPECAGDAGAQNAVSQVVAARFATGAAANDHRKDRR